MAIRSFKKIVGENYNIINIRKSLIKVVRTWCAFRKGYIKFLLCMVEYNKIPRNHRQRDN